MCDEHELIEEAKADSELALVLAELLLEGRYVSSDEVRDMESEIYMLQKEIESLEEELTRLESDNDDLKELMETVLRT